MGSSLGPFAAALEQRLGSRSSFESFVLQKPVVSATYRERPLPGSTELVACQALLGGAALTLAALANLEQWRVSVNFDLPVTRSTCFLLAASELLRQSSLPVPGVHSLLVISYSRRLSSGAVLTYWPWVPELEACWRLKAVLIVIVQRLGSARFGVC